MDAVGDNKPEGSDESDDEEEEEEEDESEDDEEVQEHDNPSPIPIETEEVQSKAENVPRDMDVSDKGTGEDAPHPSDPVSDSSAHDRQISRSPPKSRVPSPDSLAKMTESLSISASQRDIKDIVSSDLTKQRARQRQKHHSKRGAQRVGRPEGSKAKQDTRVKADKSGFWD